MLKKFLCIILSFSMIFSMITLSACGSDYDDYDDYDDEYEDDDYWKEGYDSLDDEDDYYDDDYYDDDYYDDDYDDEYIGGDLFAIFEELFGSDEELDYGGNTGSGNYEATLSDDLSNHAKKEGSWVIFVYMCGSDLETDSNAASQDLYEMMEGSKTEDVTYVVKTGGAKKWNKAFGISNKNLETYEISNGNIKRVESSENRSMANPDVLTSFLQFGFKNYEAEHYGLVFWNHGGGSITGVCFDEQHDYASLLLYDILTSLRDVNQSFELIGFDACLMSTIEVANILRPFAKYMVASEETEPGNGWDYEGIGSYLSTHTGANGAELGQTICNTFYESCKQTREENMATLSVIDLEKIPAVIAALNTVSEEMQSVLNDPKKVKEISKSIHSAENYGGNNSSEGYTNMVDLGDIFSGISSVSKTAPLAIEKINEAVVYEIKGSSRRNASGLSIYYPLKVEGSNELDVFNDVCVSRNYLAFVDKMLYCREHGSLSGYVETIDTSSDVYLTEDVKDEDIVIAEPEGFEEERVDWSGVSYEDLSGESDLIKLSESYLTEDGYYTTKILSSLDYVSSFQYTLYMDTEDENDVYFLGNDSNVYLYDDGTLEDNFEGSWMALPDGQLLTVYIIEDNEDYIIYSSPILLNGDEKSLRYYYDYEDECYYLLGTWSGIDDNGFASKEMDPLYVGDEIVPLYVYVDVETGDEYTVEGESYKVTKNFSIEDFYLPENDYFYAFEIFDIYGNSVTSDFIIFYVDDDGEVYYYEDD